MRDSSDDFPVAVTAEDEASGEQAERRCILSGAHGERAEFIRLVADADGRIWPDLAARLPGRGAWIAPDRPALEQAIGAQATGKHLAGAQATGKGGRLQAALSRALRQKIIVPDDLADRIATALQQRALQRLGLEHRAGHLIFGSDKLAEWIASGRVALLLHAADAATDGTARLDQLWRVHGGSADCRILLPAGRDPLSRALGRENIVHSGVRNGKAAARIARELRRWAAFSSGNRNPTDGDRNVSGRRNDEGLE